MIIDEKFHLLLIIVILITVYVLCIPRTVVLGDDGYFILAAYYNGIAHPPGYPVYTLLGKLSTLLPVGSIAFRVHLMSAFFAVLTCLVIYLLIRLLLDNRIYAFAGTLCYGFSQIFWSQAIIAEVYTLNTFFFFSLALLVLIYSNKIDSVLLPRLIAFLYGLALSNHWPIIILSTPLLLAFGWPLRKILIKNFVSLIPYLLLGLTPYLWMILRSQADPLISFYGPIYTWSDFWFYVSRAGYADIDTSASAGFMDKIYYSSYAIQQTYIQFGILGSLMIIAGIIKQWAYLPVNISAGLIIGYITNTFLLIFLLGFDFDEQFKNVFQVYPLIAYGICSIWLALGIKFCIETFSIKLPKSKNNRLLPIGFFILLSGSVFAMHFPVNYRANDTWAKDYGEAILGGLPANAIFIGAGDYIIGPLGYLYHVLKMRNDIELYNYTGQIFSNRLHSPHKKSWQEVAMIYDFFIQQDSRPVYYANYLPHQYGIELHGLYKKVLKDKPAGFNRVLASENNMAFFVNMINQGLPSEPNKKLHHKAITYDYCFLLAQITDLDTHGDNFNRELFDKGCKNYNGLIAKIEYLLSKETSEINLQDIKLLLNETTKYSQQASSKSTLSLLDYYWGIYHQITGQINQANDSFGRSYRIWPSPENPAIKWLEKN